MLAFCSRSRSRSLSRSRSIDSRDRKHHSSHKKAKKRHRSRSPDSPYHSYPTSAEKHKKVGIFGLSTCFHFNFLDAEAMTLCTSMRRAVPLYTRAVSPCCLGGSIEGNRRAHFSLVNPSFQDKKKSKKSKKDKKEKRERAKDSHKDRHQDSSSAKHDKAPQDSARKDSIESADEEGQVMPSKEASPVAKRPRLDEGENGPKLAADAAHAPGAVEENGNGNTA